MNTLRNGTPELSDPTLPAPEYTGEVQPNPEPNLEYQSPVEAVPGVGGIPGVSA
jgi:hypothetical protein